MLVTLIKRAKLEGQFDGVVPHLVDDGLSILQYVDDTIIFLDHDLEKAKNIKVLLCAFENYRASKLISIRVRCISLERHMINIRLFLVAKVGNSLLNT
jgi:hypothetical protein